MLRLEKDALIDVSGATGTIDGVADAGPSGVRVPRPAQAITLDSNGGLIEISGQGLVESTMVGKAGGPGADLVVLDPPRAGAKRQVVRAITEQAPRAVAYVACDPAALARDTAYLADLGYRLDGLRAFCVLLVITLWPAWKATHRLWQKHRSCLISSSNNPGCVK